MPGEPVAGHTAQGDLGHVGVVVQQSPGLHHSDVLGAADDIALQRGSPSAPAQTVSPELLALLASLATFTTRPAVPPSRPGTRG